jgi:hypothetical protein
MKKSALKKSTKVTITAVAAMGLAMCGRRHPDPCTAGTFNEMACQDAVRSGGYYWQGSWFPMMYSYPYPYYYDSYRRHVSSGGTVVSAPGQSYGRPGASPTVGAPGAAPGSSSGVERGGFGSTGSGHGAGAAGE